ncbi:MAG: DNA N-6-adenine-methyltransferase [Planctomycetota bacterium]
MNDTTTDTDHQPSTLKLGAIETELGVQPRAGLDEATVARYVERSEAGDELPPPVVFDDGERLILAGGFHRVEAYRRRGLEAAECVLRPGTVEDAVWFALSDNRANALPLSNADKRRSIEIALRHPKSAGRSDRAIAEHIGVGHPLVGKVRRQVESDSTCPAERVGRDGKTYPAKPHFRTHCTGEAEWYTPREYIEMAREVMGGIDLDPASCEAAQANVLADAYFTRDDDGLSHEWRGRVWLNPPYANADITAFTDKLCDEVGSGRVSQAILLTHNYTDTAWFHKVQSHAHAVCLTRGRIRFERADSAKASPTQGQAFFYFGNQADRFADVFDSVGSVIMSDNRRVEQRSETREEANAEAEAGGSRVTARHVEAVVDRRAKRRNGREVIDLKQLRKASQTLGKLIRQLDGAGALERVKPQADGLCAALDGLLRTPRTGGPNLKLSA